ncbi:hypothetical protein KP509_04G105100 [Ceratopteris richardii]|uniref:Potassium transporter n=1 Tax=Ceratopteris richardii TaxID=49495 RepID=A0A8T2V3K6_CERRI|nr:hypothetical protein KP509_04G105100 [Ceratopteris richardii]
MDPELASFQHVPHRQNPRVYLLLAYQSFGVVYGDLSTSPLYVFKSTFVRKLQYHESEEAVLGAFAFIFWTLTLVAAIKYVLIVLSAEDNGEGGPFALYSLLCRHMNVSLLPARQAMDKELSAYKLTLRNNDNRQSLKLKRLFENCKGARVALLALVLLGASMIIGDGVLTPAISVLSSVQGLQVAFVGLHSYVITILACVILITLFSVQHHGTHRVAFLFAPVILLWLLCIAAVGVYNTVVWNSHVVQALSPVYLYKFFRITGKDGLVSLGGVVLCITGTEAMFADLGHFTRLSIRIAFMLIVYPCLVLSYMGHAAYLSKNLLDIEQSFYKSVPNFIYWPVFVVGTLASIIGSQAVISATFSIIKQCHALSCFPRIKVVHTSNQLLGRIYIPEINWILMILCIAVTIGFRDTTAIGNAYGFAVITVMLVTTCLMTLVILIVWQKNPSLAVCFFAFFGILEGLYFSATIMKVAEGGWVPLVLAFLCMFIMYVWHYGTAKKYEFDLENKVSMKWILTLGPSLGIVRVPGIGLIYTELVSGVPAMFSHFVTNLPAIHQILVFVCIKSVHVPYVSLNERYMIGRIGPKEYHMYRCIVRYGYKDTRREEDDFENHLMINICEFIQRESEQICTPSAEETQDGQLTVIRSIESSAFKMVLFNNSDDIEQEDYVRTQMQISDNGAISFGSIQDFASDIDISPRRGGNFQDSTRQFDTSPRRKSKAKFELQKIGIIHPDLRDEMSALIEAKESGVAYFLGHSCVRARKGSSFLKKLAIDFGYSFLRRNCRGPAVALGIPHICLLEVGMIYYV